MRSPQVAGGAVVLVVVPTMTVDVVVVVAGQLTQQGMVGSSWILAAGVTVACAPLEGAGGIRYVSRFSRVARSVPLTVMVEPACTRFVPAGLTPGPSADTIADEVIFTAQPARVMVPPSSAPSARSEEEIVR